MQGKIIITVAIYFTFLFLSSSVFAQVIQPDSIYVKPAKLGIIRLTVQPLFPTISQGTFDVGQNYSFPLDVALQTAGNVTSIVTLSDYNFTLQSGEIKTVSYTIKPNVTGSFNGDVYVRFTKGNVSYTVDDAITIVVSKSDSYLIVLAVVAVVAIIVAFSGFVMYSKKRGKK
jgi:hypothetical protein